MLNHFNAGFTRRHRLETSGEGGFGGNWASKFGLKGVGDSVFPHFTYNYPGNGINSPSDGQSVFDDNVFQYDDAVSWQKGRHNFRFGGEFRAGAIQPRHPDRQRRPVQLHSGSHQHSD